MNPTLGCAGGCEMDYVKFSRCAGPFLLAACLGVTGLGVTGCSRGDGSSNAGGDGHGGVGLAGADRAYASDRSGSGGDEREDRGPVPLFHGEPVWSESRAHSAQDSATYHFKRDGADLGAKTLDDFLTKVHRFGDHPPAGTLKLVRANGDRLLYDPKANLFGVFTRQGAPRTVFKPNQGMEYWTEQKTREQANAGRDGGNRRRSDYGSGGGSGGYGRSGGEGASGQGQ